MNTHNHPESRPSNRPKHRHERSIPSTTFCLEMPRCQSKIGAAIQKNQDQRGFSLTTLLPARGDKKKEQKQKLFRFPEKVCTLCFTSIFEKKSMNRECVE
mmetsp:Transcript_6315/g.10889  ORF Transcript_6315/g.10889 Transcript_6315/m.10889 type:complete len:100 (-) Transcript_6315:196-495(-)